MERAAPTNAADSTRTKQARIERLRARLRTAKAADPEDPAFAIFGGILDLLADEL